MIRASAALLALCGAVVAQDGVGPAVQLDDLLAGVRAKHDVPALGACVLRGARVAAIGAVGTRERDGDVAVGADDLWHLGSDTKAMTATLCAIAVAAGELTFETTLAEAFPDLADMMHDAWRPVTLAQLLQHRAGMPANVVPPALWGWLVTHRGGDLRETRLRIVRETLRRPPVHEPGDRFLYSNVGYIVAGAILEQQAGAPWEEQLRARLFAPLGMTAAGFGPPGSADAVDQPRGHRPGGEAIRPGMRADNPPALGPAGTVHASLRSWARFVALHLGALDGDAAVVDAAMLARLHEPIARDGGDGYALGWGVSRRAWSDGPILTHNGSNTMWYATVWAAPSDGFAVLAVCNEGGDAAAAATDAVCAALIERFGPKVR